ncbi:hypothetical protein QBC47DRAFT_393599 [Echria macrotheca]|uniref:Uncharacterized protein n=1 Tax=Echria macrotheca TaxID=438768 RepID=A0AAJ0B2J9_9PEZI|nr:hypothetical protein QBC47DRAFT_393599 [Echria macrotheca]
MFGFRPMETIEEQTPESPTRTVMADQSRSLEGTLYTLAEPGRREGDRRRARPTPVFIDSTKWHGRSKSTSEVPATRKPSQRVREWMKRSKSTRSHKAARASGDAPDEDRIMKIDHLGGGRADGFPLDPAITIGLAELAVAVRSPKHKNLSDQPPETRVTQWIDLYYPDALEGSSPTQPPAELAQPEETTQPPPILEETEPAEESKANDDLHPAPLRCPSMERKEKEEEEDGKETPEKPPVRKTARWKPLPQLPTPPAAASAQPPAEPLLGAPPLTPDSETGAAKLETKLPSTQPTEEVHTEDRDDERERARESSDSKASEFTIPIKATIVSPLPRTVLVRHTREERMWLHHNYRGEAPFLQAWGLDIANAEDREEGLDMLRELMAAEREESQRRERKGKGRGEPKKNDAVGKKGLDPVGKDDMKDMTDMNFLDV